MGNRNLFIALGVIALGGIALYAINYNYQPQNTGEGIDQLATSTTQGTSTVVITKTGDASLDELIKSGQVKVTVTPGSSGATQTNTAPKTPSLNYVIKVSPTLAANAVTALNTQVSSLTAVLQKDSKSFDSWMRMGVLAKIAGDYPRAIEVWTYAAYLASGSSEPYANMGDLYINYMKEYPKGEVSYKKAIANDPKNPAYYAELFNLYAYNSYHPTATAAEDILNAGIKAAPDAYDLHVLLARYYKSVGKTADATKEFNAAIALAEKQGKTEVVAQLKAEVAN